MKLILTIISLKIYLKTILVFLFQINAWDAITYLWMVETKKNIIFNFGGHCPFEARPIEMKKFDENLMRYFVSFEQHSGYYNFYDLDAIMENFLNLFWLKFVPKCNLNKVKIKAGFSILNFQLPEQDDYDFVENKSLF